MAEWRAHRSGAEAPWAWLPREAFPIAGGEGWSEAFLASRDVCLSCSNNSGVVRSLESPSLSKLQRRKACLFFPRAAPEAKAPQVMQAGLCACEAVGGTSVGTVGQPKSGPLSSSNASIALNRAASCLGAEALPEVLPAPPFCSQCAGSPSEASGLSSCFNYSQKQTPPPRGPFQTASHLASRQPVGCTPFSSEQLPFCVLFFIGSNGLQHLREECR